MKDKKEKIKKESFVIDGLLDDDSVKFKKAYDSIPRVPFDVVVNQYDSKTLKKVGQRTKHITKIKIVRGKIKNDIIGWEF